MSKNDKIRRILPKPKPLLPDEDKINESIIRQYNPAAALPRLDENDPDILAARDAFRIAEEKLRAVLVQKTILRLQQSGHNMDPTQVEGLCEAEPWKAGSLLDLSKEHFGFIPEKFEALAQMHAEGSPEHKELIEARDNARTIYRNQIVKDVRKATAKLNTANIDARVRREGYEEISTKIWHFYKRAGLEDNPVYKYQAARLLWSVEGALRRSYETGGAMTNGRGENYRKFSINLDKGFEEFVSMPWSPSQNDLESSIEGDYQDIGNNETPKDEPPLLPPPS